MYSVRGYKESGIVADGGILTSMQYEYDLIKKNEAEGIAPPYQGEAYEVRKLAPLVFFDYGRAVTEDHTSSEPDDQELYSMGVGGTIEMGEHFVGNVYYGFPLKATTTTGTDDGRLNLSLMMRW